MRRRKYLILGALLFMVVVFATVTTTLVLNGTLTIGTNTRDFGIYFSKSVLDSKDVSKETISTNGQVINFNTELASVGDTTELEYEVTNASRNYDAKVSVECQFKSEENNINFDDYITMNYPNNEEIIEARSTGTGVITLALKKVVLEEVQVGLECRLNFEGIERESLGEDNPNNNPSDYNISGYLIDNNEDILPNTHMVILGDENIYITTSEEANLTIEGLDMGFHEIYVIENKTLEEIKDMTDEEIKGNALTHATITQSTKEVTFENGYKIVDELIKKKYTIYFDANGGEVDKESKEVINKETYGELPIPTREGYDFIAWYTDMEYTTPINENKTVNLKDNQRLYAKWEGKTYTINFDTDGGSEISSKTIKYNTTYGELERPTKTGYNFLGWYLGENLITSTTKYTSLEDVTLLAKWSVNIKQITVNIAGTTQDLEIDLSKPIKNSLPTPEKEGYEFDGWYKSPSDTKLEDNEYLSDEEEINLYAKFKAKKYTISFDDVETTKEVTYDEAYGELPESSKEGYNFIGWFTSKTEGEQITKDTIVKITTNQTLYGRFSAKDNIVYTVKHWKQNINGNAELKDESNYTLINTETNEGTADTTVEVDTKEYEGFTSPSKESIEVKADGSAEVNYYYTRNTYSLTVNRDEGITLGSNKTSYLYEEEVSINYTVKDGYTFKNITGDKTSNNFFMPANNVVITINTTENIYTITYNLNNGTLSESNPDSYTVTSNDITLVNPTREGYTFTGWSGSNGEAPNKNITIPTGSTENKTYTANWEPKTYKVTFDSNGGNTVNTVLTVTYDAEYGETFPVAEREGYTFDGWYTEETDGTEVKNTTIVKLTEDQTLYAHWTIKTYEVTINTTEGGTVDKSSLTLNYGGTNTFTITPSEGYYLSNITCTNGYTTNAQTGEEQTGEQEVTISNNNNDNTSVCTVTFEEKTISENLITYLTNLAELVEPKYSNLSYDDTADKNLRFASIDSFSLYNYVSFNCTTPTDGSEPECELWRIIGVMNNIEDSDGNIASHVKLIRDEPIESLYVAWDSNNINDWSNASLQKLLNGAYWNRTSEPSEECINGSNGETVECDFSSTGLTDTAKSMISKVVWNLGGNVTSSATPSAFYQAERGTNVYTGHATTWTGYVGLMYASDYGFAVKRNYWGGSCLDYTMNGYNINSCYSWLGSSSRHASMSQWTLSSYSDGISYVFNVNREKLGSNLANDKNYARPVVYLKSDILKVDGSGDSADPFKIALP